MRWYWWAAIAAGVAAMATGVTIALNTLWDGSETAKANGIDNSPKNDDDMARLKWLAPRIAHLIEWLKEDFPGARFTSCYRSPELNAVIPGASKTSRHCYGLGVDIGCDAGDYETMAAYVRQFFDDLGEPLLECIAEQPSPHCHFGWYDPLKKLDAGTGPTKFLLRTGLNDYINLPQRDVTNG